MRLIFLFAAILLVGDPLFAKKENTSNLSTFEVKIKAQNAPSPSEIEVRMDTEVCGERRPSRAVILSAKSELQDAVVWLEGQNLLGWPSQKSDENNVSALLVQKNCEIIPRTLIIPPGGVIKILNQDKILHSLRAQGRKNYPSFRIQPPSLKAVFFRFEAPEIVPLYSDLHPWMKSFVVVAPHQSHAITNFEGNAVIKKIPAGKYKLNIWHPVMGALAYQSEIDIPAQKKIEILWDANESHSQQ